MAAGFKTATVNASDVPATQTNFPAYVDLSRLGITTQAEADSVRVYADSGKATQWAREIVSVSEMWVKVPSLTSTTAIYVEWDGVSADYTVTDTYGRNAVWSNYRAVYHLNNTTDSTGNGYTLTNNNSVTLNATGILGGAADFGSGNTSKTLSNATDLGKSLTSYTYDMWLNLYSVTTYGQGPWIMNDATTRREYMYYENSGGASMRFAHEGSSSTAVNVATGWSNSTWHKVTQTWDNTTVRPYIDGTAGTTFNPTGNTTITNSTFRLGAHQADVAPSLYWKGLIDEVRVTNTTQSANWITTEYNNQVDEAGFWGTWSDVGSGTTIKTYTGIATANVKTVYNGTAIANRKTWNGIS